MTSPKTGQYPSSQPRRIDNETLNTLCGLACDRIDELFEELGVRLYPSGKCFVGTCPVHGGRNQSFYMYPDGYEARGNWYCQSGKCHQDFSGSLIGFVWGVLSNQRHGYDGRGNTRKTRYLDAVDFLLKFLGIPHISEVKVDRQAAALRKVSNDINILAGQTRATQTVLCTRAQLLGMIEVPARHYLDRGYSEAVLRKFEVGLVTAKGSREYGRVLYPVYDERHTEVIGAVSRSVHPRCGGCGLCHAGPAPCPSLERPADRLKYVRWKVVGGFRDKQHLYNLWHARRYVAESKCVVVVEGAGDVWRLEEAGVRNAVGLFGSEFTDAQLSLLQSCVPRNVVVLTDNNEAGHKAAEQIRGMMTVANTVRVLPVNADEVGDMTVADIKEHLVPEIEKRMRR